MRGRYGVPIGLAICCLVVTLLSAHPTTIAVSKSPHDHPTQDLSATIQRVRAEYSRIVAEFGALKFECKSNMRIRVDEAIADAARWKHAVDVRGLLEEITLSDLNSSEKELIIRDRLSRRGLTGAELEASVRNFNPNDIGNISASESRLVTVSRLRQRGMTQQQIDEILNNGDAITRELRPMYENLDRLTWDSLKKAYNKAYECCLCAALDFYPPMMTVLFRQMTLISEIEALQVGSILKNEECAKAVQEKWAGGAGWRGIITHTSKYKYKESGEKANNVSYMEADSDYEATIHLDGKRNETGGPAASVRAVASETNVRGGHGTTGCYRITEQRQEVAGSADVNNAVVTITADARSGRYSVSYVLPLVKATGTYHVTSKVGGTCNNPFNKPLDQTTPETDYPISGEPNVDIEGTIDPNNPETLTGSKTVTVRGRHGGQRTITVTWDLTYCKQ